MNILIEIKAPELVEAINNLAAALSGSNIAPAAPKKEADKPKPKKEEPAKQEAPKEEEAPKEDKLPEEMKDKPEVKLETVRAKLASLSQSGKQAQVKELITSFGAKKLTDVPADKYADLLEAAEEIA